jgi:hypothetical protein
MLVFWGYLGWSIVALTGVAYVSLFYRVVLFPKGIPSIREDTPRVAA